MSDSFKLGKIVSDEKDRLSVKKASVQVTWAMNAYLSIILRDYLHLFVENNMCIGNYIYRITAPDMSLYEAQQKLDNAEMSQKWNDVLISLADMFDYMATWDDAEYKTNEEREIAYNKYVETKEAAFKLLHDVWDDLWW